MNQPFQNFIRTRLWQHLEPRVLFDAAPDAEIQTGDDTGAQESEPEVAIVAASDSQTASSDDQSAALAQGVTRELVIVDSSVEDYQVLVDDLMNNEDATRDFEVIVIGAQEDGIARLTEILAGQDNLDALHIISHGEDGSFRLGNTWVNETSVTASAADISAWGDAINDGGDILLYGCDVAGNQAGQELVESLAALTQQQVAASDDDTGAADRGGDWELEFATGDIETEVAVSEAGQASYQGVLAAGPTVAVSGDQDVMIGEDFSFNVTFDNTGSDTGFGPYVDLIIPATGIDGDDGITFNGATYLGQSLVTTSITFPDDGGTGFGTIDHPYWVDATGTPFQVTGNAGDTLVVVELPFGSFTPGQPEAEIQINASVSNLADLAAPLTIQTRSGFRYGEDAIDNPVTDPSVVSDTQTDVSSAGPGWAQSIDITPTLITLQKEYVGPEDETATGPNFERQYVISVDVAAGQTISNLDIIDSLPDNIVVTSIDSVTVGGSAATYGDNLSSLTLPDSGQDLIVTLTDAVVGGATDTDVEVTISFYVPEFDVATGGTNADRIIPINGEDDLPASQSFNNARAVGDWTPVDVRDAGATDNAVADPAGVEHTLDNKSIAIQKSVSVVGGGDAVPGSVLEYSLNFQISDYYTFGDLIIDDIFQDGQLFDFTFGATFDITDQNGNVTGSFTVREIGDPDGGQTLVVDQTLIDLTDNGSENPASDGTTTLRFDVSQVLTDNGAADGILQGGLSNGVSNLGAATGTIRFRTVIQEDYADTFPSNDRSVDQGDTITNNDLTITGSVRENAEDGSISNVLLAAESDTSSASITIATGTLVKEVYAINGSTTLPMGDNGLPVIVAGDVVTYRIRYDLPTSDVENFRVTDFLPLPIFEVGDHNADGVSGDTWTLDFDETTFDGASGTIELGAGDDFYAEYFAALGSNESLVIDTANNEIGVDFGNYDDVNSTPNVLELLVNVTAQDAPTADGLFLTNIVRVEEGNTQQGVNESDALVQIEVTQPVLEVTKGIIAVDNGSLVGAAGPVSFGAVGSTGVPFTGTINSNGLASTPINANANNLDAGDRVRFAITVENTGNSARGAYDVTMTDTLPSGMTLVAGSVQAYDGNGNVVAFTGDLFGAGLELTDPSATQGAIDAYNATSGDNIVVIIYEAELNATVPVGSNQNNLASVTNYAGQEGGEDHTPTDLTDTARVTVSRPTVSKTLTGTEINNANNDNTEVVIGETVDYQIVVNVPEGQLGTFVIDDLLDAGLVYVDGSANITASAGLSTSQTSFSDVATNATVNNGGRAIEFDFGTLTNANTDDGVTEQITITLQAVVTNVASNDAGQEINNRATVSYASGPNVVNSTANVEVLEPVMTVGITSSTAVADVGNPITFTLTITNTSDALGTDAHDVNLADILPSGLTFAGNLTHDSGIAPTTLSESGGTISANWASFAMGGTSVITFDAVTDANMTVDGVTNSVDLDWTSLPGDETTPRSTFSTVSTERTGNITEPGTSENDYADDDSVDIAFLITPSKTILSTSETHTDDSSAGTAADRMELAVGEVVTFELRTIIGEGTLNDVVFRDLMTEGLTLLPGTATFEIVSNAAMTVDGDLSGANSGPITIGAGRISTSDLGSTTQIDFDLGDITNSDNDLGAEELVITFQAIVSNDSGNSDGDIRTNSFEFREGGQDRGTSNTVETVIVEPAITNVDKKVVTTNAIGTAVTYEITFSNSGNASAMNVSLLDTMATELTLNTGSLTFNNTGTISGLDSSNSSASVLDIRIGELAAGATVSVQYTVNVAFAGTAIQNDADVTYTSLPGTNGTAGATPGTPGSTTGERTGSGVGANTYADSESAFLGSISDHIFYDINGDGSDNGSDVGIPGATVNLVWFGVDGIEGNGDDVARTTTTDASGNYIFGALPAGSFRVSVVNTSLPNAINEETFDLDGTTTANTVVTTLTDSTAGIVRNDVDFGYTSDAQLGDTVFLDINNNGTQDAGEMGLANVDISLTWHGFDGVLGGGDDVTYTQTTDNAGGYNFTRLPAGSFTVDLVNSTAPSGTVVTTSNDTHTVTLTEGQDYDDSDFGLRGSGSIGDFVFFDANNNGTYDVGTDSAFPGVTVTWTGDIDGDSVDETFSTVTDNNGAYSFEGLPLDTYTITVTPPTSTTPTFDATGPADNSSVSTLTVGTPTDNSQDFGLTGSNTIGDTVFWDHDGNGSQNGGEAGLSGVTVQLQVDLNNDGTDELTLSTTTGADGSYSFTNLPAGSYTVIVAQPAGTTQTVDDDGLGTANNSSVVLTNANRLDQDFGYNGTGSIGDLVFFDRIGDGGVFNAGEGDYGLGGVDVTLNVDVNGDTVSDFTLTTTTASDGSYSFNNLVAGDYTITVDSSDTPDLIGANPTYDANGTGTPNVSTLTLAAGQDVVTQDFGYHGTPDYNIVIDDGQLGVTTGQSLTYTVTVRNDGTLRGNNAVVTVAFPTNMLESVAANTGGIVDAVAGTVTWNSTTSPALAVMNVGEEVVFTITADVIGRVDGSNDSILLTANVTDDLVNGIDPDMTDNTNTDLDHLPEIGVAKRLVSSTSAATGGNRELTYELVVRNIGSLDLTDLSLLEDLATQFGGAFQGVVTPPSITASTATTDPNFASGASTWDGNANTDMFDGASGVLRPGEQFTIRFTVEADIDQLGPGSNNQVTGTGDWVYSTDSGVVSDLSDTGVDPLGNNPGVPGDSGGEDDPTLIPAIGIAKDHGDYTEWTLADGSGTGVFTFPTILVIQNLGATDLANLNLQDDIAAIYGAQFVSVENLAIDATGVVGGTSVTPTINTAWESDTTLNMLSSGLLNPGDTFTITFDVTVNPDAGGQSGYMDNQATITATDPVNTSAVVQDLSDSGLDPGTNNPGQPGDMATADDPTPVAIPDIGLAKQIVNTAQQGLSFELTIELNLENTGTVDLNNIELSDDIAAQYGANFGRIIGQPIIVGSTATTTPTLNVGYATDTTQAIFDGSDGFLRPGESVTLRIVVEVVPEPGQTEVLVVNQATTSGNPLDENGNPLEDNSGNPIGRISDLSDSGAAATGANPGAPGNTGSWDDPTPQPLTFFTFDSFNDFSQGKKGLQQPERRDSSDPFDDGVAVIPDWHRGRGVLTHQISSLAPEPIFSGSARPGTQIFGRVYDSAGRLIGEELSMADVGGNWMMQFHHLGSQDHARFEFAELPGAAGAFDGKGDIYGYLGMDNLENDYASLEPWTFYDHSHEFTATHRPTVQQSLQGEHQKAVRPLGLGR